MKKEKQTERRQGEAADTGMKGSINDSQEIKRAKRRKDK